MRVIAYIFFLILAFPLYGQYNNLKSKLIIPDTGECVFIDSSLFDPSSVEVPGFTAGKDYRVEGSFLCWGDSMLRDSIHLYYRTVHYIRLYNRKDPDIIGKDYTDNPFNYIPGSERGAGNTYGSLQTAGNISRGIGFGNAQDIVVNSNLNLRINGELPNGVEVLAVISDENNPIQPEGNTQQIQDFDQVYITLIKDSNSITVGDFLMQTEDPLYFMKYYKKSRGLKLNTYKAKENWKVKSGADLAISRGRFSRNQIQGIEGNSGPYRLSGINGEQFIIIIAGTETVYLDGRQLTRGEDHDYVINYNTGEITFTPAVLITRYSRIVVEFQYSDRNYARSVIRGGGSIENDKWTFYAQAFNEMDLKNQPFQQSLDGFDSSTGLSAVELLALAGDRNAFIPNIEKLSNYNTDRIMYRKLDSLGTDVYVYSDNPEEDSVFYEVVFSNVGFGNGSYVQIKSSANGKVFEYRGPGLGDYEPIEILIPPKRMNMYVIGMEHRQHGIVKGLELAISSYDENTRSELDDNDNQGYGLKVFQETKHRLRDSSAWELQTALSYELVSRDFNYIERYRGVEFDRSWNKTLNNPSLFSSVQPAFENILDASAGLVKSSENYYRTAMSTFIRPGHFEGYRGLASFYDQYFPFLKLGGNLELLRAKIGAGTELQNSNYRKSGLQVQMPFKWSVFGSQFNEEFSAFSGGETDTLQQQSYAYRQLETYIQNPGDWKFQYRLSASQRNDDLPLNNAFALATKGNNYSLLLAYPGSGSNRISLNTTYRILEIINDQLVDKTQENTLQSRIEADYSLFRKFIRSRTFYQIGTGQEQRREFQYLQVQAGNGIYVWNDYDSNSVKTLNEFEIASDLDRIRADYIRIYVPVPGFITTNTNKISETLEINPAVFRSRKKGKTPLWSRFYNLSTLIFERKVIPTGISSLLNPFSKIEADTSLINRNQSIRSTLFFNRSASVFGSDYTYIQNETKTLLTNGFDSRSLVEHKFNVRWNVRRSWTINSAYSFGNKSYTSEFFAQRNFNYTFWEIRPKLQYQFKNLFRLEFITAWYEANNAQEYGGQHTENLEIGMDVKLTRAGKGSLESAFNYIKVDYSGNPQSTLGYVLLRGLQDGNNATWNLSYQQRFADNIQFIIRYDGRKSEDAPVIHIGNLVARYLF